MGKDILINASILAKNNGGLGVYTYQMLGHLPAELDRRGLTYDILCEDASLLPPGCRDHCKPVSFGGFVSRAVNTSKQYSKEYRLAWSTTQHGGLFSHIRQIITIHDITPIIYPDGRRHQYYYYKHAVRSLVKKSSIVFTVSENTKNDIVEYYHADASKVRVVYESIDDVSRGAQADFTTLASRYGIESERYFVTIGINYEYKNLTSVIEAFAQQGFLDGYKVVLVGNDTCAYAQELKELVAQLGCANRVVFTGFIDDAEKNALLRHSVAEVYPTLYEGFGIPVLEAMQMGVPIICSNRSSLPEVGGDAPLYFEPANIDELRGALTRVASEPGLRAAMVERGKKNAQRFSWPRIVEDMVNQVVDVL